MLRNVNFHSMKSPTEELHTVINKLEQLGSKLLLTVLILKIMEYYKFCRKQACVHGFEIKITFMMLFTY